MAQRGDSHHVDSRIAEAAALREEGNALWHAGDVKKAMFKYHACLNHLNGLDRGSALSSAMGRGTPGGEPASSFTTEQDAQWRALFVAANLNLAAGLVKVRGGAALLPCEVGPDPTQAAGSRAGAALLTACGRPCRQSVGNGASRSAPPRWVPTRAA